MSITTPGDVRRTRAAVRKRGAGAVLRPCRKRAFRSIGCANGREESDSKRRATDRPIENPHPSVELRVGAAEIADCARCTSTGTLRR